MGVNVDEAGREREAFRINDRWSGPLERRADLANTAIAKCYIQDLRFGAAAVQNARISYKNVTTQHVDWIRI